MLQAAYTNRCCPVLYLLGGFVSVSISVVCKATALSSPVHCLFDPPCTALPSCTCLPRCNIPRCLGVAAALSGAISGCPASPGRFACGGRVHLVCTLTTGYAIAVCRGSGTDIAARQAVYYAFVVLGPCCWVGSACFCATVLAARSHCSCYFATPRLQTIDLYAS